MARLIVHNSTSRLNSIPASSSFSMMESYFAKNERMTSTSYSADMTVIFNPAKVHTFLSTIGVTYADRYSDVHLVIPVAESKGEIYIWGDTNISKAVSHADSQYGLSRFKTALGDLADIEDVSRDVLTAGYNMFEDMLHRYGADDAIILFIKEEVDRIDAVVRFVDMKEELLKHKSYRAIPGETDIELYSRIVADLYGLIDSLWKGIDSFDSNKVYTTTFHIPISSPEDWAKIRDVLSRIEMVSSFKPVASNIRSVVIEIKYLVEPLVIYDMLYKNGFTLKEDEMNKILLLIYDDNYVDSRESSDSNSKADRAEDSSGGSKFSFHR